MPSTKLAFFRYMLIDQMLRNRQKPYPSKQEILKACTEKFGVVSHSTIEKDLSTMRIDFDAPIIYNKKENGYAYSDLSYRFLSVNLSEDEKVALGFVETLLEEFRHLPLFSEFSDAVDKVLDGLEIAKHHSNTQRSIKKAILIDQAPYVKGKERLNQLIRSVIDEKVLRIQYQKHDAPTHKFYIIHPYLLKEYKGLWYLIGYVSDYKQVRTFGVDRIESVVEHDLAFIPEEKTHFDSDVFYQHCIGVTALNEQPQEVILSFEPLTGKYIKTQALHSSQKILLDDDSECCISLHVIINTELQMLILSYGRAVKVVSPPSLTHWIQQELKKSLEKYN